MPPKQAPQGKGGRSLTGKPPGSQNSTATFSRPPPGNNEQPNKRKHPQQSNNWQPNPRAAKRIKINESRSIAVQKPHAALKDGELNVSSFVTSMAFEINALDESMRRSRTSGTSRAFQRVPFSMRRRTAAHNYKRIPKRLRRRARREMVEDNTPIVNSRTRKPKTSKSRLRAETARRLGILARRKRLLKLKKGHGPNQDVITARAARPKIRRNELNTPPVTAPKYRKRQLNKTWLPTHLWHAKRARMTTPSEPLWGFSLPLTPTQKNYRPTHRVQWEKGAMAWDMSYMSTIGLFGKENHIQGILKDIGLVQKTLWNDKGKRWRAGAVHWSGDISRKVKNTSQYIGPATIIWNPQQALENPNAGTPSRQLFIRVHPSAFSETFNELLRVARAYKPRPYLQDLRHEIGSIELTGPDSTEALLGVLKPFHLSSKGAHASRFESLLGLRNPASLPLGSLLAFSILDPRLKYPPRQVQPPQATEQQTQIKLMEAISAVRKDEELEPYQLFDRNVRFRASMLPCQKSVNRRRGNAAPGTTLDPSSIDPPIPIMLLASRNSAETQVSGTWTVMLPWKCVRPVWYSLMHYPLFAGGNPAFGGLDEIRQLAFERCQPWFPGNFPGTDAGNAWETLERQVRQKVWDRKPKGKRVNWESLDLGSGRRGEIGIGWSCAFETLFGFQDSVSAEKRPEQRGEGGKELESIESEKAKTKTLSNTQPLTSIFYLPKTTFNSFLSQQHPEPLPTNSVISVGIRMLGRGVVTTCARVYRIPDICPSPAVISTQAEVPATEPPRTKSEDSMGKLPANLRDQWLAQRPVKSNSNNRQRKDTKNNPNLSSSAATSGARKQALAQGLIGPVQPYPQPHPNTESINGHPLCPDAEDLIGFVTTGNFSLRDGRGEAIASLSAQKAMEEMGRYKNPKDPAARLCVVRDAGQSIGWLARWELV
ncbi:ribonucleases P/MRP protein subunit POP1-domain-containing protein [Xylariaceae sp. FL1651]|nr:ribonucleases P/MRP protein subunit POP1-domain-containing protein [Xylariaceae sp. FL1651]